jgi:hypothetical protein
MQCYRRHQQLSIFAPTLLYPLLAELVSPSLGSKAHIAEGIALSINSS